MSALLVPAGAAAAQEPVDSAEALTAAILAEEGGDLPVDVCGAEEELLEADDLLEVEADARAAARQAAEEEEAEAPVDEDAEPTEPEDLSLEDLGDGCGDEELNEALETVASGGTLGTARRSGKLSTGSVKLRRAGTVSQVVTVRSRGRTITIARSTHRVGSAGTLQLRAKLNQAGRRVLASAAGTVKLKVRTTVSPKGGTKRITIRTITLRGGS